MPKTSWLTFLFPAQVLLTCLAPPRVLRFPGGSHPSQQLRIHTFHWLFGPRVPEHLAGCPLSTGLCFSEARVCLGAAAGAPFLGSAGEKGLATASPPLPVELEIMWTPHDAGGSSDAHPGLEIRSVTVAAPVLSD